MTNQPMLTHNCGVMHLVFFNFWGMLGLTMAAVGPDPVHFLADERPVKTLHPHNYEPGLSFNAQRT